MTTISDLEAAYRSTFTFEHEVDRYIEINIPQVSIVSELPESQAASRQESYSETSRYTSRHVRVAKTLGDSGDKTAEVCINRHVEQLVAKCDWLIAGLAVEHDITTEYDVQCTLDPDLFDKPDDRVLWAETERASVTSPCVNFYSSRLAKHSEGVVQGLSYRLKLPHKLVASFFFDFTCAMRRDITGAEIQPQDEGVARSAGERNIRALALHVRCFARLCFSDQTIVLRSDLARSVVSPGDKVPFTGDPQSHLVRTWLLGYFSIHRRIQARVRERRFGGETFSPVAVLIHVADNASFSGAEGGLAASAITAHYLVGDQGEISQFVEEEHLAAHAGNVSLNYAGGRVDHVQTDWRRYEANGRYFKKEGAKPEFKVARTVVTPNEDTIGVEHQGTASSPWGLKKYVACAWLLQDIYTRWPDIELSAARVVPHNLFTGRDKQCPGTTIDMDVLLRIANGYRQRRRGASEVPAYVGQTPESDAPDRSNYA